MRLKSNIGVNILNRYEMNRVSSIRKAFNGWRIKTEAAKTIEKLQTYLQREHDSQ
jgi:hypothetical protein